VRPSNAPTRPAGATDDRDSSRVADALTVVDAPVVVVATLAVVVTVLFDLVAGTARLVVAAPLLFFAPGYALTTALFPRRRTLDGVDALRRPVTAIGARGLGWVERVAVSFATSLALLPPLAVLLSLLDAPLAAGPLAGGARSPLRRLRPRARASPRSRLSAGSRSSATAALPAPIRTRITIPEGGSSGGSDETEQGPKRSRDPTQGDVRAVRRPP